MLCELHELTKPETRKTIREMTAKYGPILAEQVVQTLLVAAGVGRLPYAFRQLNEHFQFYLKWVPFSERGLVKNSPGVDPTEMFLHYLQDELTIPKDAPKTVAA